MRRMRAGELCLRSIRLEVVHFGRRWRLELVAGRGRSRERWSGILARGIPSPRRGRGGGGGREPATIRTNKETGRWGGFWERAGVLGGLEACAWHYTRWSTMR